MPRPSYQWRHNAQALAGETNRTLNLLRVETAQAGVYSVVVSNEVAAITSAEATLIVEAPSVPDSVFQWVKSAGGSGKDYGRALAVDPEGNLVVAGTFSDKATFGTLTLTSAGGDDVFVAKCDRSGAWLWAQRAGGSSADYANAIAADASGNIYVTGAFAGNADFDATTLTSQGGHDIFLVKYDRRGQMLWARQAGSNAPGIEQGRSLAVDRAGNVFVTGEFLGAAAFGAATLSSAGLSDVFVAKYDASGRVLWAKRGGGFGNDSGAGMAVDEQGNAFVTGFVSFAPRGIVPPTVSFDPFTFTTSNLRDFFVAKYDAAGNVLWAIRDGGPNDDYATGIAVDAAGDIYVTGKFQSYSTASSTSNPLFLSKYDTNGKGLWGQQTAGENPRVAVDGVGKVYVAGSFSGQGTFINSTLRSPGRPGQTDIFVMRFDRGGNLDWVKQGGGAEFDSVEGLAADVVGNAFLTGTFYFTSTFDGQIVSGELSDLFVAELSPPGAAPTSPLITTQPVSQTSRAGDTVQFLVFAAGNPAPAFQWQFNGANLPGATKPQLVLPFVRESDAGSYQVAVRNPGGEVLSQAVQLTVTVPAWVTTLAGSGISGFKDGAAAEATFSSPSSLAVGPDRSVFIADTSNHRIRRISPSGEVSTFAGTGAAGFADGPAASAQFNLPTGLFVRANGDLLVADAGNHRIRRISAGATPNVSTLAGSGSAGYQDGAASNAKLLAGDGTAGLLNGPATNARFNLPQGLAVDAAGNLFVSETANHAIRRISSAGIVSTLATGDWKGAAERALLRGSRVNV